MSLVLFITIPAMVGLIVLREPIVALLFKHGAFDAPDHAIDLRCAFCTMLWDYGRSRLCVLSFRPFTPCRIPGHRSEPPLISIVANMLLGMALMGPMKHCGLALATSLASMVNLVLLVLALRNKLGVIRWRLILSSCLRTLAASGIMALGVVMTCRLMIPPEAGLGRMQPAGGNRCGGHWRQRTFFRCGMDDENT